MWRISLVVLALSSGFLPTPSWAGAWTLERGQMQVISGFTVSGASKSFDDAGKPTQDVLFSKMFIQNSIEYGLTDAVTLFAAPEYVTVHAAAKGQAITRSRDTAVEAGVRILLLSRIGMLSIQASAKTADAFDMTVSANQAAGRQAELRLLYGRPYTLFGDHGFIDLQVAERWISRPRPNEMTIDATLGLWLRPGTQAMFQSFNTISGGGGSAPYASYRMHKLEFSLMQQVSDSWSLQIGGLISPFGQNTVAEQGFAVSIWSRF